MNKAIIGIILTCIFVYTTINTYDNKEILTSKSISYTKDKEKYDKPDEAAQWLQNLRKTNNNLSPAQLNKKIRSDIDKSNLERKSQKLGSGLDIPKFKFENLGPSNFGGRVRGFVINSDNTDLLLAGAVSGGVFKSENAGQSWSAKSDFLPTLAIGSMIGDPDNSNRVFAGTGEGFFNFDASRGAGIFVSNDFGESWSQLPSTNNSNFYYVNRLARVANSDIIIAATRQGIFRSENLGQSWSEVSNKSTSGRGFIDLKSDPSDSNHLLASHFGFSNSALSLNVSAPTGVADEYSAILSTFGPNFPSDGTGDRTLVLIDDGVSPSNDGCSAISTNLGNKIALIQRGTCDFTVKVKNAQLRGAIAVIVYQNTSDNPFNMGGSDNTITIPSAMISLADGELLAAETGEITAEVKDTVIATLGRFMMESNDAGASWQTLNASNGLPETDVGRMELAFGSDGVTYVAVGNNDNSTRGLWRSNGSGANFSKTASETSFIERQGWYDLALAVNPEDSDIVFMGAVDQFKTTDAGATISINSFWAPRALGNQVKKHIHADQHGYFFSPSNSNHMYVVSDGGVYKTEDNGVSYIDKNSGLSISQPYGIAVSPNGLNVTSGTQDNGSQIFFGDTNSWLEWHGGDGGYSAWDQQNGNYIYGSTPRAGMFGSSNSGNSTSQLVLPDTDGASFIQPFDIDPNDGNRLIIGTNNLFYTDNARALEKAVFVDISGDLASGSVSALTFNQNIATQVLVAMASGNLYKINEVGTTNTLVEITPTASDNVGSLSGAITDIKIDSNDDSGNTIYITRANYRSNRILKSIDGGESWESLSGNLPNMPLFQVSIDPTNSNRIFVGSELGLWVTNLTDSSPVWEKYEYGVSNNRIIDLVWSGNDTLYVATHGRGTYKASRSAIDISLTKFITTDSSNENDGILDRGESGLMMINLKNNSGYAISGASLSINQQGFIPTETSPIAVETIPAHSSIIVPINFSLPNDASCLDTITINTELSYTGATTSKDLEVITSANKNRSNDDFIADAESSDSLMTTQLMLGSSAWTQVGNEANSGSKSWFTSDENQYSDKSLISPWLVMNSGGNVLSFALKYSTELQWDGVLLEIRQEGGLWSDIGNLSSVEYDGQLQTNNTAQARFAWNGNHNTWRNSTVNLAEIYKGKTIQFRFRMISDTNSGGLGFWVDDINITNVIWEQALSCDDSVSSGGRVPFNGLWYDPSKNGHGFAIEPLGYNNLYYTIFYTYDNDGNPEWYTSVSTLNDGVLNLEFSADTLERFIYDYTIDPTVTIASLLDESITDGRLSINFNSEDISSNSACQDGTEGRLTSSLALAHWKINDQEGEWCIQPLIGVKNIGNPDIGGTWYNSDNDAGWGMSLALFKSQLVSIVYYYDVNGFPRWSIGQQDGFQKGEEFSMPVTEVSGYGRLDTPIEISTTNSGSMTISIENKLNNIQIDGKVSVGLEYQGSVGGEWNRNNVPFQIYTLPHE